MNALHRGAPRPAYELRFRCRFGERTALSFPCDVQGHVDMDGLGDRTRNDYLFARTVIGRDFLAPEVVCRRGD
jgi:hypothetical protein